MAQLTLYYGNTNQIVDEIISAKKCLPKYKSKGNKHFLGDGYYFYDDPVHAKVWAKMKVARNLKYINQSWAVLKCTVNIEDKNIFDLDRRDEQDFFFEQMLKIQLLIESGNLKIDNYHDSYLCNYLANILGIKLFCKTFSYKDKKSRIITPVFTNIKSKSLPITRHFRTEKQYCLKTEIIINPTKYEYGIIKKRGDIYG